MASQNPEDLIAEAQRLEAEAIEAGEEAPRGRELRGRAAELRRNALGARVYPVVICSACFRVTGWVAADGRCDACLRHAQLEAAYADPHGGWVAVNDTRAPAPKPRSLPLAVRLAAIAGRRSGLARAEADAWMKRVDPDETGPIEPEIGWTVEGAHRAEFEALDGSGILVRFSTATHRFTDGAWVQQDATRIGHDAMLVPAEFSAAIPIEQLAKAWADFQGAVESFNRSAWTAESEAREARRQAAQAHDEALLEQRHTSELLDDSR